MYTYVLRKVFLLYFTCLYIGVIIKVLWVILFLIFSVFYMYSAYFKKNVSLLKAGWHIGINTVGQSLRNANLQLRSEPSNPQVKVSPWMQSTIGPDTNRKPLEIGENA